MLTGTFQRSLDSKSRFTLPAEIRKELTDQICLIPLNGVLYGFTPEGFKAWVNSQFDHDGKTYNPRDRRDVRLKLGLTSRAKTIDVDSAGRIALGKVGAEVLAKLGLGRDLCAVGADDHFEVWDAEKWAIEDALLDGDLDDLMFGSN